MGLPKYDFRKDAIDYARGLLHITGLFTFACQALEVFIDLKPGASNEAVVELNTVLISLEPDSNGGHFELHDDHPEWVAETSTGHIIIKVMAIETLTLGCC